MGATAVTTPDPVAVARGAEIIEHELQHSMIMPRPAEAIRKILAALEIVATAPQLPREEVLATLLQTRARVLTELGELGTKSEDHGSAS
jgi:hypothetical protein